MSDISNAMPPVQFTAGEDVKIAFFARGERGAAPPVVLCHGFPELAFSWRHQLKALGDAGRWAIAPDQRGYGLTPGPADVAAYDMEHLTGDLLRLLDHLDIERAIFCGHDWGGAIVWHMPLMHPDRTAGVIGLNTPFTPRAPADPIQILRMRFGDAMYIVHFQTPGVAEAVLEADVAKTMSFFMRRPPAGQRPSGGLSSARAQGEGSTFALVNMVAAYKLEDDRRETFLTPEELQVFVDAFSASGFTGGINWYRNITRNWERSRDLAQRVDTPALMITAELDAVLPPSAAEGMEAFVPDLETHMVVGSGHWTQQEQPEQTNRLILDWLDRRFPLA